MVMRILVLFALALLSEAAFACKTTADVAFVMRLTHHDRYLTQVVCQVMDEGAVLKSKSFDMIPGFTLMGRIQTNHPIAAKQVYLNAGTVYAFAGACDSDCKDLDIKLLNSDLNVVAEVVAPDDTPVVVYKPTYSGYFSVVPILAKCVASRCAYAVLGYSR